MRDLSAVIEFWTGVPLLLRDGVRLLAARSIMAAKIGLREVFPVGMVHDPVVDMLLSIYIVGATTGPMPYDDACAASGVTASVAKRWLMELEKQQLIIMTTDAGGRWVSLSDKGLACAISAIDAVLDAQAATLA